MTLLFRVGIGFFLSLASSTCGYSIIPTTFVKLKMVLSCMGRSSVSCMIGMGWGLEVVRVLMRFGDIGWVMVCFCWR